MKSLAVHIAFALALSATAQTAETGSICGTVLDENGQPARSILVTATYLGAHSGPEPASRSDGSGRYCLGNVPFGESALSADDPKRGYPDMCFAFYSAASESERWKTAVTLSAKLPHAERDFRIPYKGAFLTIHLSDAATGTPISGLSVKLRVQSDPDQRWMSTSQVTSDALLLPPNENVLLQVSAPGYREWPYDGSPGYVLNMLPGERKAIDVKLQSK